jgi:hypothetical protein
MRALDCNIVEIRGLCRSSGIGIKKNDKWVNYSHRLAQNKQQVNYYVVVALLVHKQVTCR